MKKKLTFHKKALSVDDQIKQLERRGLDDNNVEKIKHILSSVSYYRLSAYFKPFQKNNSPNQFNKDVTFDMIWGLYVYDHKLRLIILDAIERIEISLRTVMSNEMAIEHGNTWYLQDKHFGKDWVSKKRNDKFKDELDKVCKKKRSQEECIKHYYDRYVKPEYPPSWMVIECLSFGMCTSLYRNLRRRQDKNKIASFFKLDSSILESHLELLRYSRNLCAHHSRLWNRHFPYKVKKSKALNQFTGDEQSTEHLAHILQHYLKVISPNSSWYERFRSLHDENASLLMFIAEIQGRTS